MTELQGKIDAALAEFDEQPKKSCADILAICRNQEEKIVTLESALSKAVETISKLLEKTKEIPDANVMAKTITDLVAKTQDIPKADDIKASILGEINTTTAQEVKQVVEEEVAAKMERQVKSFADVIMEQGVELEAVGEGEFQLVNRRRAVKEQLATFAKEEERRNNIITFNLPEGEEADDKRKFLELTTICGVALTPDDVDDVRRLGSDTATKPRPLRVTIKADDAEEKKKKIFKNLEKLREFQRRENGGDDPAKPITVTHDMSQEQRAEKKKMLRDAYKKNQELGPNADVVYRVRGPPWAMFEAKIPVNRTARRPQLAPAERA